MTKNTTFVSVLMTTYNSEKYVSETIKSVVNQTYKNWEFIIIDDASTDGTYDIITSASFSDDRIKIFRLDKNHGQSYALNFGLKKSSCDLIARIDNDDLMARDRIEKQVSYMNRYPEVAVVGTYVNYIDSQGRFLSRGKTDFTSTEEIADKIKNNELVGFNHPTVMMRKEIILKLGGYRSEYWPADDIDLWNRILENGYRIEIIPEYLTDYRIHSGSVTIYSVKNSFLKAKFVKHNLIRRRSGKQEITFNDFLVLFNETNLLKKVNSFRKLYGQIFYKKAVFEWASRNKIKFLYNLIISLILNPFYTFGKASTKI